MKGQFLSNPPAPERSFHTSGIFWSDITATATTAITKPFEI